MVPSDTSLTRSFLDAITNRISWILVQGVSKITNRISWILVQGVSKMTNMNITISTETRDFHEDSTVDVSYYVSMVIQNEQT